jgi:integrative and conjugative element protein (TIGR02256 family)
MIISFFEPQTQKTVFIGEGLLTQIHLHTVAHSPREFGGILTGIIHENSYFILDIQTPEKFENSRSGFTRHAGSLNEYLKRLYGKTSGTVNYIGEWHSHPNADTAYSENDKKSMLEIAADSGVRIKAPLLLIVSVKQKSLLKSLYITKNVHLLPFTQIENV